MSGNPDIINPAPTDTPLSENEETNASTLDLPHRKRHRKYILREKCIGTIKQLSDSIYHLQDINYLEDVLDRLKDLAEKVQMMRPSDSGLNFVLGQSRKEKEDEVS